MQELSTAGDPSHQDPSHQDPYLWLEDVDSARALDWVGAMNRESEAELAARPEYGALKSGLKTILDSKERIPYVALHGDWYYNFWKDAEHPRGLWRRTTLEQFRQSEPRWELVLDLDALAASEDENWVWAGSRKLEPRGDRALVSLSRGGGDAHVVREFDLTTLQFVNDGFSLPEAKSSVGWIDRDSVFVATDFGDGSMTSSGYPRIVKAWRRGTPLASAVTVYEAQPDDLSASAWQDVTPGFERQFVQRQIDFYTSELFLREPDGRLTRIDKPEDANAFTVRDQMIVELRSDWALGGHTYPQGALLAMDFDRFMAGERDFALLFTPSPTTSLDGIAATRGAILLTILDKVTNCATWTAPGSGATSTRPASARSTSRRSTSSSPTIISWA
jgi:prolyl oligopeptidase